MNPVTSTLFVPLAAFLVFILPGGALVALFWPSERKTDRLSLLGVSAGLSAAFYPVWILLADIVGWQGGAWLAWGPTIFAVFVLARQGYRKFRRRETSLQTYRLGQPRQMLFSLVALVALGLLLYSRLIPAMDLVAPLWGDSVHHTMITQLIIDRGGLFQAWEPYARLETFTYHFGFHSLTAAFGWLTGLDTRMAVLWSGQILNILAVVALYPLAETIWKSRWAALTAVALAGLMLPIPMIYINWGRYTQLAAQVVLPITVLLAFETIKSERVRPGQFLLAGLAMAGLALTHYRILIFGSLAFAVIAGMETIRRRAILPLVRVSMLTAGVVLVVTPWFIRLLGGRLAGLASSQLATAAGSGSIWEQLNRIPFSSLLDYVPPAIILIAILGLLSGIWLNGSTSVFVIFWWSLILLAANPAAAGLPGTGIIGNFTVLISTYILIALLAPGAVMVVFRIVRLPATRRFLLRTGMAPRSLLEPLLAAALIGVAIWGTSARSQEVNAEQAGLVTHADVAAAAWIEANLPLESLFYVNQFFAFNDTVIVGSDAGWWLPLLAGRATTLPPINYTIEEGPRPDYIAWVNELPRQVQADGLLSGATIKMLHSRGVTHIYVGQRAGRINYAGPHTIDPAVLEKSRDFELVYHQDGVWIFELASEQ